MSIKAGEADRRDPCPYCETGVPIHAERKFGSTHCSGCQRTLWYAVWQDRAWFARADHPEVARFVTSRFGDPNRFFAEGRDDVSVDSLDLVELLMIVEREFGD